MGVDEAYNGEGVDPLMLRTVNEALRVFTSLGAEVKHAKMPAVDAVLRDWAPNCAVETAVAHEATFPARRAEYGPGLAGFIDSARGVSAAGYQKILLRRRDFAGRLAALFQSIDLLLIPSQFIPSPTMAQMVTLGQDSVQLLALMRFTSPFDMSGSPTITLPSRIHGQGDADRLPARGTAHGRAGAGARRPRLSARDGLASSPPEDVRSRLLDARVGSFRGGGRLDGGGTSMALAPTSPPRLVDAASRMLGTL